MSILNFSLRRRDSVAAIPAPGPADSIATASVRPGEATHNLLSTCSNPQCRSGWIHLWRRRSAPIFEGGWLCSQECTEARLDWAVRRELDGRSWENRAHRHRIPLGLLMLKQGWITQAQLREALHAQRTSGTGSLGWWLVQQNAATDTQIARALALQWSSPVLTADPMESASLTTAMPRLFVDAFNALPLRLAAGQLLYLGFERRPDPVLALGIEQITGLRVESGIVSSSQFAPSLNHVLACEFPHVELIEAAHAAAAARALARAIEKSQPIDARLTRVHDCLWLRMWYRRQAGPLPALGEIQDLLCSISGN
ncbi:MAG TPA: hypothetical protein VG844_07800 [Terracidiphilus sp.]|nr:hypothetical protein [Terracidiphilus sp.]